MSELIYWFLFNVTFISFNYFILHLTIDCFNLIILRKEVFLLRQITPWGMYDKRAKFVLLIVVFVLLIAIVSLISFYSSDRHESKFYSLDLSHLEVSDQTPDGVAEDFVSLLVDGFYDKAALYLHPTYLESEGISEDSWVIMNTNSSLDNFVDGYEFMGFAPASELAFSTVAGNPEYVALFRLTSDSKEPVALSTYPVDLFLFLSQYDGSYRISFGSNDMMLNLIELGIETTEDAFSILSLMEEGSL